MEIQIAFHAEAEGSSDGFELREQKVSELAIKTDYESKEQIIVILRAAFCDIPGPVGAGQEELHVHNRVLFPFLRIERRKLGAQLVSE